VSIVGHNINSTHRGTFPTMVGGGIGYASEVFSIEVDGLADLYSYESATARFMGGGEVLAASHFPIRAGYQFDQGAGLHSLSAGLGYVGREFSIEASLRRTLSSPGSTMITVGLAYFLESSTLVRTATEGYYD
jgi:hypothetical protein